MMTPTMIAAPPRPAWLPDAVRIYLDHTDEGLSLRELARRQGCHASTVMRQIRRFENRRDDPLVDAALDMLARGQGGSPGATGKDALLMSAPIRTETLLPDDAVIAREGRRILRRMVEPGALLAIAPDMEKAVVLREFPDGKSARTAVVDRAVAQAFALKDWITCRKPGRVAAYGITQAGRAALRRLLDEGDGAATGFQDAQAAFGNQHREFASRVVDDADGPRRVRYNIAESPVAVLGRKRDKDGQPFLSPELVQAAERLREDFEAAQMGPRVAQNWDRFLTAGDRGGYRPDSGIGNGPANARDRVALALRDLGPGLGDVVLRCCCFLEGLETAERRMGWAARSGKIVLRIALQRLRRHYDETYGRSGPLIG